MTAGREEFDAEFLTTIEAGLSESRIAYLLQTYRSVEAIARHMLAALPTVLIEDPPVGPCHTTAGLAAWRGVTRQALLRARRDRRVVAFPYEGAFVYPTVQFGPDGKSLPVLRDLLATVTAPLTDAVTVAAWLHNPDASGRIPTEILEANRVADAADRLRRPEAYYPRLITVEETPASESETIGNA